MNTTSATPDMITFNTEKQIEERLLPKATQTVTTFNLVPESHKILRTKLKDFDFANPPVDPNQFASSLVETCKIHRGFGLSANQCGFEHRVFVMGANDNFVAFFNPSIVQELDGEVMMMEGCLSFPLMGLNVYRSKSVVVEYQDFRGEKHTTRLEGLSARCFQHELDHMNGIVYTSKAKPLALKSGLTKRAKLFKQIAKNLAQNRAGQLLSTPSN